MERHKLALKLDDLNVTSFAVSSDGEDPVGTVHGQQAEIVSNPRTCASQCWSLCIADTDCCTEAEPTYCYGNC